MKKTILPILIPLLILSIFVVSVQADPPSTTSEPKKEAPKQEPAPPKPAEPPKDPPKPAEPPKDPPKPAEPPKDPPKPAEPPKDPPKPAEPPKDPPKPAEPPKDPPKPAEPPKAPPKPAEPPKAPPKPAEPPKDPPKPAEPPKAPPKPAEPPKDPPKPAEPPKEPFKPYIRVIPDRYLAQGDRDLINKALPTEAIVKPKQRRRLLIFDLNVGYDGHRSTVCANYALVEMGKRTKAFEAFVSHDPTVFYPENLKVFDAVVFNNTVGNVFAGNSLRKNLEEFVKNGGGLLGIHAATETFVSYEGEDKDKDTWPLFGEMIGARGMAHRETDEKIFVQIEDKEHPITQVFPKDGFFFQDEILRFREPYSRQKVRVLLSMDKARSNLNRPPFGDRKERPDEDYALVWVKSFGKGRSCYSVFGHNPRTFWDPTMLKFYLAAAQFVLGDLDGSTTPSQQ